MTREETKQIIRVIADTYPNWKPNNMSAVVDTWYWQLQNDDYKLIATALMAYNRNNNSGFAPSIGQLIDIANNTILSDDMLNITPSEAWARASKALRNSTYNATEEFNKLPFLVQRAVGSAENLRSMAMDENLNMGVVESNFRRAFESAVKQYKTERTLLPMAEMMEQLRLSNGLPSHALEARQKHDSFALTVDELSR